MKRQNVSLGPHNLIRTISPLLTFLFGRTYFSPLPRRSSQRKTAFADFVMQPGVLTVTFVKIVFSCLVMGQLLTYVDSKNLFVARIMYIHRYPQIHEYVGFSIHHLQLRCLFDNWKCYKATWHIMGRVLTCRPRGPSAIPGPGRVKVTIVQTHCYGAEPTAVLDRRGGVSTISACTVL